MTLQKVLYEICGIVSLMSNYIGSQLLVENDDMFMKSNLICFKLIFAYNVIAKISVVDKGILPLVKKSIAFRIFVDVTNEDRQDICILYSGCRECCLNNKDQEDCDILKAFGENIEIVKPRDRKTILYVAPVLQQHDFTGYCNLTLNYNCNNTKDTIDVTVPIDTRVDIKSTKALLKEYVGSKKVTSCKNLDEDSLNGCKPVDCSAKYLDKRPVFDDNSKKCITAPICLTNTEKDLPDYVYVPYGNTCRNLDIPVSVQDIYAISSGLGIVTTTPASSINAKLEVTTKCSTISQNLNLLRDLMYGKLCPITKGLILDYGQCFKSIITTIVICILSICAVLFLLVLCINTAVWMYIQWSEGKLKGKWKSVRNFCCKRRHKRDKRERVNSTIRNALLREVIVKDIPLELRNSAIDVCGRIGREVEMKRRYRKLDVGSQISLQEEADHQCSSMSSSTTFENEKHNNQRSAEN